MKQILGNRDRERTSKVDTEKWKEHSEYYNNPENLKKEIEMPLENSALEKILQYDSEGRPRMELTIIKDTVVHTPTQEIYDALMQVCESGGWRWGNDKRWSPTEENFWKENEESTCILARDRMKRGEKNNCLSLDMTIISHEEFYRIQNITSQMLKELNQYYDTNAPNRASKG